MNMSSSCPLRNAGWNNSELYGKRLVCFNSAAFLDQADYHLSGAVTMDNLERQSNPSAVQTESSGSLLSDVYNWGSSKIENATQFVKENPGTAIAAAATTAALVLSGRALLRGALGAAEKEAGVLGLQGLAKESAVLGGSAITKAEVLALSSSTMSTAATRFGLPVVALSALGLAGCSQDQDLTVKDKPKDDPADEARKMISGMQTETKRSDASVDPKKVAEAPKSAESEKKASVKIYETPQQCAEDGMFTEKFCNEKFEEAKKVHMEIAPKFESKEQCEKETGTTCGEAPAPSKLAEVPPGEAPKTGDQTVVQHHHHTTTTRESSSFMPYIVGYMIGRSMSDSTPASSSHAAAAYASPARPLYSPPASVNAAPGSREFVTADGNRLGSKTGSVDVPQRSLRVPDSGTVFRHGNDAARQAPVAPRSDTRTSSSTDSKRSSIGDSGSAKSSAPRTSVPSVRSSGGGSRSSSSSSS